MPDIEHYEILVIGSGEAGKHLTWNMAQAGHRTELARVGLNESEAKRRGIGYRLAKLPMAAVLRAVTLGETRGFRENAYRYAKRSHPGIHRLWY